MGVVNHHHRGVFTMCCTKGRNTEYELRGPLRTPVCVVDGEAPGAPVCRESGARRARLGPFRRGVLPTTLRWQATTLSSAGAAAHNVPAPPDTQRVVGEGRRREVELGDFREVALEKRKEGRRGGLRLDPSGGDVARARRELADEGDEPPPEHRKSVGRQRVALARRPAQQKRRGPRASRSVDAVGGAHAMKKSTVVARDEAARRGAVGPRKRVPERVVGVSARCVDGDDAHACGGERGGPEPGAGADFEDVRAARDASQQRDRSARRHGI
mmetsp:Transcript_12694/g.50986  ORF Transcript_12694/g.50986 Transcript_12694/m.50986 type:complete len:271 (+) Transcript_12694:191-1003(+)